MAGMLESARFELERIISRRLGAATLLAAVIVPVAACAIALAAFGGARDRADALPVAVVNLDAGATDADGHQVAAGEELVESLVQTEQLAWAETDEQTAASGLEDGTYALVLEIPEDYSACVASASTSDPKKAEIRVLSSGSSNVLATEYGTGVLKQVQSRVRADLGEDYLLSVLNDVRGQSSRLTLAADGTVMLDQGFAALEQGSQGMAQGLEAMAGAVAPLGSGISQIGAGVRMAGQGTQAMGEGVAALGQGMAPVQQGLDATGEGLSLLAQTTHELGSVATGLSSDLAGLYPGLAGAAGALSSSGVEGSAAQASSMANDLSEKGGALAEARAGVDAAAEDVSGLEGTAQAAKDASDAADDLAAGFRSEQGSADKGLVERADALSERIDGLDESAVRDEAAGTVTVTLTEEELAALKADASDLAQGVSGASEQAEGLVSETSAVAASTASAAEATGELSGALDAYGAAADDLDASAAALVGHVRQDLVPALDGLATAQEAVERAAQALQPTLLSGEADPERLSATDKAFMLAQGVPALGEALDGVATGADGLSQGLGMAMQALSPMAQGLDALGQGDIALADALDAVGAGAGGLSQGLGALSQGQEALAQGTSQLRDASSQVTDTVSASADALSPVAPAPDEQASVASAPVTFTVQRQGAEGSLVPLAVASALWVGPLAFSLVAEPVSRRMAFSGARSLACVLSGALPYVLAGLVQAAVLGFVATALLGVPVSHPAAFAGCLAVAGAAFGLIAQALAALLGRTGAAAASLAWLALSLAAAGGILPEPLSSGVFQALSPLMPAAQLASALRFAVAGTAAAPASPHIVAVAVAGVAALAASIAAVWRMRALRPERAFAR